MIAAGLKSKANAYFPLTGMKKKNFFNAWFAEFIEFRASRILQFLMLLIMR